MGYEGDDCRNCGKENATLPLWPENNDHDYNKVCDENCYDSLGEAWEELAYSAY